MLWIELSNWYSCQSSNKEPCIWMHRVQNVLYNTLKSFYANPEPKHKLRRMVFMFRLKFWIVLKLHYIIFNGHGVRVQLGTS